VWQDFASQTYKELAPVGPISYRDPFSGSEKTYSPPGGGPGYYRVPTLISIWATAPFLHKNSLGLFNNDPSTAGRLAAFDDAIVRLLWPAKRQMPSTQVYWDGEKPARTVYDAWYEGKSTDQSPSAEKSSAQRELDGGWIWRTTEESWLQFDGPHVPYLIGGVLGLSPYSMSILPWLPALAFLTLGTLLLLSERLIALRERYFAWLWWILAPIWWVLGVGSAGLAAVGTVFVIYRFWPLVMVLDLGTQNSIWGLRLLAIALPIVLFGSLALLFTLHRIPPGRIRRRIEQFAGAVCLVLALIAALGLGRFLSGRGEGIKLGPIPEGVPLNILANVDPNASKEKKIAALNALEEFILKYRDAKAGDKAIRKTAFEEQVAPALLGASKCPDFVTDGGHDYQFIRYLTDEEKRELIALLKTF
jgi:hypothetical protein